MSQAGKNHTALLKNATEERLFDRALTLFAEKGFAATSVREIIEATGVTRPVLYYYCDSKQDLFERVVRWKHDAAYEELENALASTEGVANQLLAILRGTFKFCGADPRVPQLMFQATFGPGVPELAEFLQEMSSRRFAIVARIMQDGIDAGQLRGGSATSLAMVFCSIMDYHANTLSRLPGAQQKLSPELASGLVDVFLSGVSTGRRTTPALPATLGV